MRRLAPLTILALSSIASAQAAPGGQVLSWIDRELLKRIQISGFRQFGFHAQQVDGDREAFNSLTYYGQGGRQFTDTGSLTFAGRKVLGLFDFDVTLTDNRYQDPQAQKLTLNYDKGPLKVQAGDILASLVNTNPYVSLNRQVKGASIAYQRGHFAAKALRTETKGSARTISFQGTNSAGPYYLQSSQLVTGSESILVDGQPMTLGTDYVIDYQVGSITFVNRMIPPTSTITVTYEAFDFNSARGTIQGAGASYDFGRAGRIGVTAMEQTSNGSGGLSSRLEQFQGFGAASTPYFLQFEPMNTPAFPTLIRVDGILQVLNVDYFFDPNIKSVFYFRRFIPASSIVEVVYFPKPTSIAEGDRRVIGVDYRLPLNSRGYVSVSEATGSLKSDVNPLSGTAKGINVSYESGGFKVRGGLQDIPQDFVSIETRGFNRNERSGNVGLSYKKKGITYDFTHSNSSVSTRIIDNNGQLSFGRSRETLARVSIGHTAPSQADLSWNLSHTRTGIQRLSTETKLDSTELFASQSRGRLTSRYGLDNQVGQVIDGKAKTKNKLSLQSVRFDADYAAGNHWTVAARAGVSHSKFGPDSGTGHDLTLDAVFRPTSAFSLDFGVTDSESGQISTLAGFTGRYGTGYDGNGFSGGNLGASPIAGGGDLRLIHAHALWKASSKISVDGRFYKARTAGSVSSNTDTMAYGFGLDWDLGRSNLFSLELDRSETSYIGSPIKSSATTLDASLSGRLTPRLNYHLGTSLLLTGGNSDFSQNSAFLDGSFTYKVNPRQNASLRFSLGNTNGYYPQREIFAGMFYEYQLYRNVSLVGSYKWRNVTNLDPTFTSGAYRSRGFDLEISFNFGG